MQPIYRIFFGSACCYGQPARSLLKSHFCRWVDVLLKAPTQWKIAFLMGKFSIFVNVFKMKLHTTPYLVEVFLKCPSSMQFLTGVHEQKHWLVKTAAKLRADRMHFTWDTKKMEFYPISPVCALIYHANLNGKIHDFAFFSTTNWFVKIVHQFFVRFTQIKWNSLYFFAI